MKAAEYPAFKSKRSSSKSCVQKLKSRMKNIWYNCLQGEWDPHITDIVRLERIFLVIPACSVVAYVPSLLMFSSIQAKLLSILSITSLISTAYMLLFIPNVRPRASKRKRRSPRVEREPSLIDQYLGYLNGGLSFLIALNAWTIQEKKGVHDLFWTLCLLPSCKLIWYPVMEDLRLTLE